MVNLRPQSDGHDTDHVLVDSARIERILRRIASDIEELARAQRVTGLSSAEFDANPRLERRRRLAEPPIEALKGPMSMYQTRQTWEAYERLLQKAGLPIPPNPYRHFDRSVK